MSSEDVNVEFCGFIRESEGRDAEPDAEPEGLWPPIKGDFPLREGVPLGVTEVGLACILVENQGFVSNLVQPGRRFGSREGFGTFATQPEPYLLGLASRDLHRCILFFGTFV